MAARLVATSSFSSGGAGVTTRYQSFASSQMVRERMQRQSRASTGIELDIRRRLHALGLRYRVNTRPVAQIRYRGDIVFRAARVVVDIRGCFWHACPEHGMIPATNSEWWKAKFAKTRQRDTDKLKQLRRHGWRVIVIWEHDDAGDAAAAIARLIGHSSRQPSRIPQSQKTKGWRRQPLSYRR